MTSDLLISRAASKCVWLLRKGIFYSSLKCTILANSVCHSKAKTELPPNVLSQNNVYTLH